jgi:lipid A disaccharide synthetase
VAPEFVQGRAEPSALARAAGALLDDAARREGTLARFRQLRASLAGGGGAGRVADLALELVR